MLTRAVGLVAAGSVVVVNALVLPPGFIPATNDLSPFSSLTLTPATRAIRIPCPACTFSFDHPTLFEDHDGEYTWPPVQSNELELSFRIAGDNDQLQLNGVAIYPHQFDHPDILQEQPVFVKQVSTSSKAESSREITSSWLRVVQVRPATELGDEIVTINYQILALGSQQLPDLSELGIELLRTKDGQLAIVGIVDSSNSGSRVPSSTPNYLFDENPSPGRSKQCNPWVKYLCNLRAKVEDRLKATRYGKTPCSDQQQEQSEETTISWLDPHFSVDQVSGNEDDSPHHSKLYSEYHHHRPHFIHTVVRGIISTLIPIVAGICVGLVISCAALAIAQLVGHFYCRLAPGGARKADSAKGKLLVEPETTEALPAYEDAPPYEDLEPKQTKN